MWSSIKRGATAVKNWVVQKSEAVTMAVTGFVGGLVSMFHSASAWATSGTSLIPAGSLDQAVADIEATGTDAFSIIVPVVVTIAALLVAVKLIKRFLNRA